MAPTSDQNTQLPHPACFRSLYIYRDCKCAYLSPESTCYDRLGSHYHPLIDIKRSTFKTVCKPCELFSIRLQKDKKITHWTDWLRKLDDRKHDHRMLKVRVAEAWENDCRALNRKMDVAEGRKDDVEGWEFVGGKEEGLEVWKEV